MLLKESQSYSHIVFGMDQHKVKNLNSILVAQKKAMCIIQHL